jgi:hypothetical protein
MTDEGRRTDGRMTDGRMTDEGRMTDSRMTDEGRMTELPHRGTAGLPNFLSPIPQHFAISRIYPNVDSAQLCPICCP